MKKILLSLIFVFLYILMAIPNAYSLIIDFDELTPGIQIFSGIPTVDTLIYPDLIFEGKNLSPTTDGYYGIGYAVSSPNKLTVLGQNTGTKEETSINVNFTKTVFDVSFWITGTFHDTNVFVYDIDNNLIENYLLHLPMIGTSPSGEPWDIYYDRSKHYIALNSTNIKKILIQPQIYDGFSIDDISYNPIPEPTTLLLFGTGLAGAFMRRKRRV